MAAASPASSARRPMGPELLVPAQSSVGVDAKIGERASRAASHPRRGRWPGCARGQQGQRRLGVEHGFAMAVASPASSGRRSTGPELPASVRARSAWMRKGKRARPPLRAVHGGGWAGRPFRRERSDYADPPRRRRLDVTGDIRLTNADCAEDFDIADAVGRARHRHGAWTTQAC